MNLNYITNHYGIREKVKVIDRLYLADTNT